MKHIVFIIIFLFMSSFSELLFAQVVDPAYYTLPGSTSLNPATEANSVENINSKSSNPDGFLLRKKKNKKRAPAQEFKEQSGAPKEVQDNENDTKATQEKATPQNLEPPPSPEVKNKMRDFVLGGDFNFIDEYKKHLDREDIRRNIFDFSVGSEYFYNHSQSPYFYRNYITSSPGAFIGLDLWMTPFFALDVNYKFSLLNTIKDHPSQDVFISSNQDWLSFGFKFRRFFGLSLSSSSFSVALNYVDHQFTVPAAANYRMKTRTRGPELAFELDVASSKHYFWTLGMNILPYLTQDETAGSRDFTSGQSNQSMGFGCFIGGEYRMNRSMATFFKLSTQLYRTMFSGSSNGIDPLTGSTTTNTVVSDSFVFFDIGLKFGK